MTEAERKAWNEAIEAAAKKVWTLTGTNAYVRAIHALRKKECDE